ncbi:MAG: hypothetical protein SFU86_22485 [Pirellulaceae bacterium]|nr:hypothetical protein [Pirellulaceae bacterium]
MRQIAIASLLVLAAATSAQAQWGGWGGGWGNYSSTVEEGVQRGFADVVRSQGMANLMNSMAAGTFEDARTKYLQNRMLATQTYFDMRRYNQQARAAERGSPLSSEQYVRLARMQAPDRLSVSQLDPLTGLVNWPAPLRRPAYDQDRATIEALFKQRAAGTAANYDESQAACRQLLEKVRANVMTFSANDFIAARRFVESLAFEITAPPQ